MSASTNEKTSGKERKDIWVELQSLRQDAQAFRAEAYRLRVAGSLDAATNERLRTQQLQLERRGESLIKRCVYILIFYSHGPSKDTGFLLNSSGGLGRDQVRSNLFLRNDFQLISMAPSQAGGNSMDTSQLWLPGSQMVPTSGNSLQLQASNNVN